MRYEVIVDGTRFQSPLRCHSIVSDDDARKKTLRYLLPFKILVVTIDGEVRVNVVLMRCTKLVRGAPA